MDGDNSSIIYIFIFVFIVIVAIILIISLIAIYGGNKNKGCKSLPLIEIVGLNQSCAGANTRCADGLVCDPNQKICLSPSGGPCNSDADCFGNETCNQSTGQCQSASNSTLGQMSVAQLVLQNSSTGNTQVFGSCSANSDCQSGVCAPAQYYHLCNPNVLNSNSSPSLSGETLVPLLAPGVGNSTVGQVNLVSIPGTNDLLLLQGDGTLLRIMSNGNVVPYSAGNVSLNDIGVYNGSVYGIDSNGNLGVLGASGGFQVVPWNPATGNTSTAPLTQFYFNSPNGTVLQAVDANGNLYTFSTNQGLAQQLNSNINSNTTMISNDNGIVLSLNKQNNVLQILGANGNSSFNNVADAAVTNSGRLVILTTAQAQNIQSVQIVNGEPFYLVNSMCIAAPNQYPNIKL